ncbi:MAG: GNAT family N-acetyltransferase, partial [Oscillatoriales cyanobacterium]
DELTGIMVSAIDHFCDRHNISGCNFLYVDPVWRDRMERHGFSAWLHHSYIWQNQSHQNFDAMFGQMYAFYENTCDKFGWWGSKYLTKRFFEQLHDNYRDRVLFVAAYDKEDERQPMGMSFCLYKGDRMYGRYWGSLQEIDCLHFDACYYTPIEWAIDRGIQTFDPGAGGRHKKRRGFPATPNYSLHRFYNNRLAQILKSYIGQINEREQAEIDAVNEDLPFTQLPPLLLGD